MLCVHVDLGCNWVRKALEEFNQVVGTAILAFYTELPQNEKAGVPCKIATVEDHPWSSILKPQES